MTHGNTGNPGHQCWAGGAAQWQGPQLALQSEGQYPAPNTEEKEEVNNLLYKSCIKRNDFYTDN